ncbi:hypothetical protein PCC7418_2023 [Halothece sp. PCC 7418]|nr:hypothetical protein PCC7418_2023 [Halothece sp. PCC 7418]
MITIEDQIDHFLTQLSCSISETIVNLVSLENLLILVLPLLVILYRIIKQLGIWDQFLGRDKALVRYSLSLLFFCMGKSSH